MADRLRTTLHAAAGDPALRAALANGRLVSEAQAGGAWPFALEPRGADAAAAEAATAAKRSRGGEEAGQAASRPPSARPAARRRAGRAERRDGARKALEASCATRAAAAGPRARRQRAPRRTPRRAAGVADADERLEDAQAGGGGGASRGGGGPARARRGAQRARTSARRRRAARGAARLRTRGWTRWQRSPLGLPEAERVDYRAARAVPATASARSPTSSTTTTATGSSASRARRPAAPPQALIDANPGPLRPAGLARIARLDRAAAGPSATSTGPRSSDLVTESYLELAPKRLAAQAWGSRRGRAGSAWPSPPP